jgi:hypothetical protein
MPLGPPHPITPDPDRQLLHPQPSADDVAFRYMTLLDPVPDV